jgi:hypothetical protein
VDHGVAQVAQQDDVLHALVVRADLVDHLHAARRADAARRALAARLDGAELHRIARELGEVGRVVVHHDAAVAHRAADGRVGLVVQRQVPLRFGQVRAQRAAHLHRLDRPARGGAAAVVVQQLAQRDAEGLLDQPAVLDVAGQLHRQRAARTAHAEVAVVRGAARKDQRHARERDHVVDERRLPEETGDGRQRRLGAHDAALAFQAFEQRGFFAAHIRARALAHFEPEGLARAEDVVAEEAGGFRRADRLVHGRDGVRVFGADVDVALGRAGGDARDGHALDEHERVALHRHAVGESARVAFVGIADDVLLRGRRGHHRLPLDARRERRAATAAQARVEHLLHHFFGLEAQRAAQARIAFVRFVVGNATRDR